jgi:LmbE family N-acetylglucosaminyl deacetylase
VRAFVEDVAGRIGSRLRPLRNRGFRSRMRHDPAGPVLVLSPHLDDAVLDCWSVLTASGAVRVVNVFAGVPAAGSVSYYERLAGARDSAEHVRRRLAEDREALALAGRAAVGLGFLARTHRRGRPEPSFRALDARIAAQGPVSAVYAPAALGAAHPDHELVRSYALALARQGVPVRLFADVPYSVVYGLPAWVTGGEPESGLDVDAYWGDGSRESAEVVRLDPAAAAAKLAAMRTYRSEFAVLDRGPLRQLSNPAIHGFEVFWPAPNGRG